MRRLNSLTVLKHDGVHMGLNLLRCNFDAKQVIGPKKIQKVISVSNH